MRFPERSSRRLVARASDRRLEQVVGSAPVLRAIFTAMARRFVPAAADGFTGDLHYALRTAGGGVRSWTVRVGRDAARALPGPPPEPSLTVRLGVADFARMAAGELDPGRALLDGRLDVEGDLALAMKLGPMFALPGI